MTDQSPPASEVDVPQPWKRNVTLFLTGQTVSLFGSMIVQYAVMWYVTIETKSGIAVALYAIAAFLPQGLVSIFGGVLADRVNRRILVMTADAVIAAATLVLALLMLNGITDLWIIVLAVAIRSVGAGVQTPAVSAMIPQLTPPDQLMRVNGIYGTISSAMALLAPAAAGVVFGVFGIVPVFFIDVVTAVIGIGILALVTVPTLVAVAEKTTSYREDLVEGIRFIWHHPIVRWLLVVFALIFVLVVAPSFVTPLMIARDFGDEVWKLTVLELAFSIGMLLGGVGVSTFLAKRRRMPLILIAVFGFAAFSVGLGLSPDLIVFYAFHVPVRPLRPAVLDTRHDAAARDGAARDARTRVQLRQHRHGTRDAGGHRGVRAARRCVQRPGAADRGRAADGRRDGDRGARAVRPGGYRGCAGEGSRGRRAREGERRGRRFRWLTAGPTGVTPTAPQPRPRLPLDHDQAPRSRNRPPRNPHGRPRRMRLHPGADGPPRH